MRWLYVVLLILLSSNPVASQLLINEIACAHANDDWVELFYQSEKREKFDVSGLLVTMYYGENENLSDKPVTIYSYDRPETIYDDRFIVVHFTDSVVSDETDCVGDANRNGCIDLYCNNYSGSLWNSECVVAVDTDDDPENGGIIDFVAYSNCDGSPHATMTSYVCAAQSWHQWTGCEIESIQDCMIDIGADGLEENMTIVRTGTADTNSKIDFQITKYPTPGKPNIFSSQQSRRGHLFRLITRRVVLIPRHPTLGCGSIDVFVYETCHMRFRVFSSLGRIIYESHLYRDVYPGFFSFSWKGRGLHRMGCTGLYIGQIEALSSRLHQSEKKNIYIILSRYQ